MQGTQLSRRVYTTGLGKSYFVAARAAASLSSIGMLDLHITHMSSHSGHSAQAIHAAEWGHGDLGVLRSGDVAILFSNSGETAECVAAASALKVLLQRVHCSF